MARADPRRHWRIRSSRKWWMLGCFIRQRRRTTATLTSIRAAVLPRGGGTKSCEITTVFYSPGKGKHPAHDCGSNRWCLAVPIPCAGLVTGNTCRLALCDDYWIRCEVLWRSRICKVVNLVGRKEAAQPLVQCRGQARHPHLNLPPSRPSSAMAPWIGAFGFTQLYFAIPLSSAQAR